MRRRHTTVSSYSAGSLQAARLLERQLFLGVEVIREFDSPRDKLLQIQSVVLLICGSSVGTKLVTTQLLQITRAGILVTYDCGIYLSVLSL